LTLLSQLHQKINHESASGYEGAPLQPPYTKRPTILECKH